MPSAPPANAIRLAPPASSTTSLSFIRCWALRSRVTAPAITLFKSSLRCTLYPRNNSGAVAEPIAFHPGLLKDRQVQVRDRRAFRKHNVLADELDLAVAATHQ